MSWNQGAAPPGSAIALLTEPAEIRILHLPELAELAGREPAREIHLVDWIARPREALVTQRLGGIDTHAAVGDRDVADLVLGRLERLAAAVLVVDHVVAPRRG